MGKSPLTAIMYGELADLESLLGNGDLDNCELRAAIWRVLQEVLRQTKRIDKIEAGL